MATKKRAKKYWLMKSEPDVYSIGHMEADGTDHWEGIRNYQARNFMRDMQVGDLVLFYHSNAKPPGVVGVVEVCKEHYPDPVQFDPKSKYFDPKSKKEDPRWSVVDVKFLEQFEIVSLQTMKDDPDLEGMLVLQKGSRLSVTPVDKTHFKHVLKIAGAKTKVR